MSCRLATRQGLHGSGFWVSGSRVQELWFRDVGCSGLGLLVLSIRVLGFRDVGICC